MTPKDTTITDMQRYRKSAVHPPVAAKPEMTQEIPYASPHKVGIPDIKDTAQIVRRR
jgi:hypothetical protein